MSKTTKLLLLLLTSILLLFTSFRFAPFSLSISRQHYSGCHTVTLKFFTKSPLDINAKSSCQHPNTYTVSKSNDREQYSRPVVFDEKDVVVLSEHPNTYTVSKSNDREQYSRPDVFDEKDVVILSEKNFSHFIANNRYVMVVFYAPWSHLSKELAREYAVAATMLKGEASKAVLAKVDYAQEELVRDY